MVPIIISACPPMYFVAEFVTKSAPKRIGLCNTGLQKVLSTTVMIFLDLAKSHIYFISQILRVGFVGVSIQITLVFLLMSFSKFEISHISIKSTSILKFFIAIYLRYL